MSDGIHGHGTTLEISTDTTTNNYSTIGNVISISGPNQARDVVDISTMDSTNKWREKIPAMIDAGEATIEVNYDGTAAGSANGLQALLVATTGLVRIRFPDHATVASQSSWVCQGVLTGLGWATPFDDKVTQSISVAFTGSATYKDIGA